MQEANIIIFTLVYNEEEHIIQTRVGEYFSLMDVISQNLMLDCFGICSGMGSCGTCMVKMNMPQIEPCEYKLSCAVDIDYDICNKVVTIPNDRY